MTKAPEYATTASPPLHTVVSVVLFTAFFMIQLPSLQSIDEVATMDLFSRRLFPDLLSLEGLIFTRLVFFLVIYVVSFQVTCFTDGWRLKTTYSPKSKLRKATIKISGIRTQFPYTSVSWNILGLNFGLSSYIAYCALHGKSVNQWILRLALICWETAAPNTLLVSAIVRYAIWPAALKNRSSDTCKTWRALLWHNGNSFMSLLEASLLGGLPVLVQHLSFTVLLGCFYVLFAWLYMYQWTPGKGPNFIYFFLDTTLGKTTTITFFVLSTVFMLFHGIFALGTNTLEFLGEGLLVHVLFLVVVFGVVCRFRDY